MPTYLAGGEPFPDPASPPRFYLPRHMQRDTGKKASLTPSYQEFAASLTQNNRHLLKNVHIFANAGLFSRQDNTGSLLLTTGACPEVLTITVRHVDWPGWQTDDGLSTYSPIAWLNTLLSYPASYRLREIHLELETISSKVDRELRPLVHGLRDQYICVECTDELGSAVRLELQDPLPEKTWSGPASIGGREWPRYHGLERLEYRVLGLAWKVRRPGDEEEDVLVEKDVTDLPMFSFCDADREPKGKIEPENAVAQKQWEERWEREGSLLKFAEW